MPPTPQGKPDFETVDALDSRRLTDDVMSLLRGVRTEIPNYSFKLNNPLPRGQACMCCIGIADGMFLCACVDAPRRELSNCVRHTASRMSIHMPYLRPPRFLRLLVHAPSTRCHGRAHTTAAT